MENSSKAEPFYKPWVGNTYDTSERRLLILGESHYGEYAELGTATCDLTKRYMTGGMNYEFWTNIQTTVHGSHLTVEERPAFWNDVAFYNYVQTSAGATAGIAPTAAAFTESESAFFNVLDQLKPKVILVLSTRLWNRLPGTGPRATSAAPISVDGKIRDTWAYGHAGGSALASWIPHPSIHFSPPKWQPWVKALIEASVLDRSIKSATA